jgi:hypothetical protein
MTRITKNRLAKRMLLLFVLTGTLLYLKAPTKAHAITCETCLDDLQTCLTGCDGNGVCRGECVNEFDACDDRCTN